MISRVESRPGNMPNGATRLVAIVGDPIAQVRAPAFWSTAFRARGIDMLCIPTHVPPAGLLPALRGLQVMRNVDGIIVTVPHKAAACRCVDRLSARAAAIGAINVMRREADDSWSGDMFDGIGFVDGLTANGIPLDQRRVLLVGAGGAGTAIGFALAGAGVREIRVFDTDGDRAIALRDRLSRGAGPPIRCVDAPDPSDVDLAVNATPLGLRPDDRLPLDVDRLAPATIVADVIMKPRQTRLLRAAAERGCRTHDGVHMMDHQAPHVADFFRFPGHDWSVETVRRLVENEQSPGGC